MNARATGPRGFTLIEVLVAVFVMTVGLLGIAALQITSKQTNFEALQRMTASQLAQEMLERIRANPGQLAVYTNNGTGRKFDSQPQSASCSGAVVTCLASQIAEFDLYEITRAMSGITEQAPTAAGAATPTGGLVAPALSGPIACWSCGIAGPVTKLFPFTPHNARTATSRSKALIPCVPRAWLWPCCCRSVSWSNRGWWRHRFRASTESAMNAMRAASTFLKPIRKSPLARGRLPLKRWRA